eukprot:10432966-Lingulodinium_polyedra.AAC.1
MLGPGVVLQEPGGAPEGDALGASVKLHEECWGKGFQLVGVQEHSLRLQVLTRGQSFNMVFSPATAGGKLGTAVWWRPAGGSKVKVIDYDCSGRRITT